MQTIIMPGQQVVSILVAQPGGAEEAFVQLLSKPYDGSRCTRTATPWEPSNEFPGCQECTISITASGNTRQLRLLLGECTGNVAGLLRVVVDRYCKGHFKLTSNVLHLKAALTPVQLHSVVNSVAALVFRGKNWTDRNGNHHPEQTGDIPDPNSNKKKSGGHHGGWRLRSQAANTHGA